MVDVQKQEMLVLVRAQLAIYGQDARGKATERARALAEMGDQYGALLWHQICEELAATGSN